MNHWAVHRAREMARDAGYDPDQLVVEIDKERDFDLMQIDLAPVDITKIKPVFMKFYQAAVKEQLWESQSQLTATT